MATRISIHLYATLGKYMPPSPERYPISPGETVGDVVDRLAIPRKEAKLVFIDNARRELSTPLSGGERVGIFPPVGGG